MEASRLRGDRVFRVSDVDTGEKIIIMCLAAQGVKVVAIGPANELAGYTYRVPSGTVRLVRWLLWKGYGC